MSNRIRILYHCNMEGQLAHVGRKALKAMHRHIQMAQAMALGKSEAAPPTYEWVDSREWHKRGKPAFRDRQLDFGSPGHLFLYNVPMLKLAPERPPLPPSKFKGLVEEAQWLWQHLPQEIRQESQLTVTRESRMACWRRSRCNPQKFGWTTQKARDFTKNAKNLVKAKNAGPSMGNYWTVQFEPATWNPMSPVVAASGLLYGQGEQGLTAGLTQGQNVVASSPLAPAPGMVEPPPLSYDDIMKLKEAALKSKSTQFKAKVKDLEAKLEIKTAHHWPAPKKPKTKVVHLEEPEVELDDEPEVASKPNASPKTPVKPKLKLGVWA